MSSTSQGRFGGLTVRSVLIGVVIAVIINMWGPFSIYRIHSSLITDDYMPLVVVFLFLPVVAGLNVIFKLINPKFGLSVSELIIVFIMGLVGASIPTYGLTGHLIATIAAPPYYFATPENHWAEYLHPHIPDWIVPSNKTGAMACFFEGLPEGAKIPWGAWVIPLFWWIGFAISTIIVGFMIFNWFNPLFPRIPMSGARIMIGSGITFDSASTAGCFLHIPCLGYQNDHY